MGRQSRLTFPYYSQYYNNKKSLDILYKTNIEDSERWKKGKKLLGSSRPKEQNGGNFLGCIFALCVSDWELKQLVIQKYQLMLAPKSNNNKSLLSLAKGPGRGSLKDRKRLDNNCPNLIGITEKKCGPTPTLANKG